MIGVICRGAKVWITRRGNVEQRFFHSVQAGQVFVFESSPLNGRVENVPVTGFFTSELAAYRSLFRESFDLAESYLDVAKRCEKKIVELSTRQASRLLGDKHE